MAAISKACAPPRSPISARSRGASRSARRRCWSRSRNRPKCAGPTARREVAHRARDRVLDRVAPAGSFPLDEIAHAKAETVAGGAPADADARAACRRSGGRGRARPQGDRAHHRREHRRSRSKSWRASARTRSGPTSRSPSWRSINATGEVLARVAGADYFDERRAGQVDMTQAVRSPGSTLEALHLRPRLRGRADPSRDADRGSADPLRQLRAGEFRPDLPGHGLGAQGAADVAQRAGGRGARRRSAPTG